MASAASSERIGCQFTGITIIQPDAPRLYTFTEGEISERIQSQDSSFERAGSPERQPVGAVSAGTIGRFDTHVEGMFSAAIA